MRTLCLICGALLSGTVMMQGSVNLSFSSNISDESVTVVSDVHQQQSLRLPGLICDNMVLQQNSKARLWGSAIPNSEVLVTTSWNPEKVKAKSDATGHWELQIPTPAASFDTQTVTIQNGKEKRTLKNILIGEVWLGGGQSNMQMPVKGFGNCPVEGANESIALAGKYPYIRYATITRVDKGTAVQEYAEGGDWKENTPDNTPDFGAAAYYFATKLSDVLQVPIGIINCSWGGSRVEGWLPQSILQGYEDINLAEADDPSVNSMRKPVIMYNSMLKPSSKYTIKGFVWYQGESNVGCDTYAARLATMVEHWRQLWGEGEIPFYEVEIAPYQYGPGERAALLREQQYRAQSLIPNSGMISTNDLVEPYELHQIHPKDKQTVGARLAYMALANTYGYKTIADRGPEYKSMEKKDNRIILTFVHAIEGFNRFNSDAIEGFEIAGADRRFYPAVANANGSKVEVRSSKVPQPEAVRYCFRNFQVGNLKNLRGLPTVPFRTDSWNPAERVGGLRIMSYNIRNGRGLDEVVDYQRIADVIKNASPDIVAIQELDSATIRNNGVYTLRSIADKTGLYYTYTPAIAFQGGKYGIGMLSKEAPVSVRQLALPGREENRTMQIVEFKDYVICNTHFSLTPEDQLLSIPLIQKAVADIKKPVFMTGDMNSEPNSATQKEISKTFTTLSNPKANTFPANDPNICIDYIYGLNNGTNFKPKNARVLSEASIASDHSPIMVDVEW